MSPEKGGLIDQQKKLKIYETKYPGRVRLAKESIRKDSKFSIFYSVILLIRDYGFTFSLILFAEYPLVALLGGIILYTLQTLFILKIKPRSDFNRNLIELVNSLSSVIILILFLVMYSTDSFIGEELKGIFLGVPILILLFLVLFFNTVIMIISSITKIVRKIKRQLSKKNEKEKEKGNEKNFEISEGDSNKEGTTDLDQSGLSISPPNSKHFIINSKQKGKSRSKKTKNK